MARKDPGPDTCSAAYEVMAPKWDMITHLLGGTSTMRDAGRTYLPQHTHEDDGDYDVRLAVNTLTNYVELTLDSLVGKPFSERIKRKDDIPEKVAALLDDIDLQGNDIDAFCRRWFRDSIAKSFSHVLIDFPKVQTDEQRTYADDLAENNRPYWCHIAPEQVIFAAADVINGIEVLTHVRIREQIVERQGWEEVTVDQIRVLEPGTWAIYRAMEDKRTKKIIWKQVDAGTTSLNFIPMVTFYSNHQGLMLGKPPLEDLAYLNVRHWQSTSDQINVLTVARFPMLAVAGATDTQGDVMAIGPKQLLGTRDANGKFYYVEHTGKAISAGKDDLEKLEQYMASYGAEFLRKKPGGSETATARALDSAEATSPLQDMTYRFMDAINMALWMTAQWLDEDEGGSVELTTDFGPDEISDVDMRTLNEARRNRDLGREQYLQELQRRGVLPEDFDYEENVNQLKNEPQIESPFATGNNTDGSAKSNVDNRTQTET